MKIIVKEKVSQEVGMTFEYHANKELDPKVAVLYAMHSAAIIVWNDATELMHFVMWVRDDAMKWTIVESEKEQIARMEELFDLEFIEHDDIESKIKEATEVKDLFN